MRKANKAEPSWNMSMTVYVLAKLHVTLLPLGESAMHCMVLQSKCMFFVVAV